MSTPHATIIGAGIVGISTAAFLQRAGFAVTVIDRVPPGEGCSFGNAGGLAFAEVMPTIHPRILMKVPGWLLDPLGPLTIRWRYLPKALPWFLAASRNALPDRVKAITQARAALGLRVMSDFRTILAVSGSDDLLVERDTLRLYDTEADYAAEAGERAIKSAHGYEMKRLSPGEIAEIEPAVARDFHCGAFYGGWYFVRNPHRLVTSIAKHVAASGGEIVQDEVRRVIHDGARCSHLQLASGERPINRLVICAGAYSGQLTAQFGEHVLLEAERGYHLTIPNPGFELGRTVISAQSPIAMTPMEMGLRLAGTDEFAGLEAPPNWKRADVHWTVAKRVFPALRPLDDTVTRWMGRRPGTPDGLPVIGPSRKLANVWYGFGHSHMGLAWGPTTGRLIAEDMGGEKSNIDLAPFRVDRF